MFQLSVYALDADKIEAARAYRWGGNQQNILKKLYHTVYAAEN